MRPLLVLASLVLASGCSFTEVDPGYLEVRPVASAVVGGWPPTSLMVARTPAEAEALADAFDLGAVPTADFSAEALVAVSTLGACHAQNFAIRVDAVEVYPGRTRVYAVVEETDEPPARALAHPVAVVAVAGLGPATPTLALDGAADACTLEQ